MRQQHVTWTHLVAAVPLACHDCMRQGHAVLHKLSAQTPTPLRPRGRRSLPPSVTQIGDEAIFGRLVDGGLSDFRSGGPQDIRPKIADLDERDRFLGHDLAAGATFEGRGPFSPILPRDP